MYGFILIAILGLLVVMLEKKENMLLNVNKTTQLYKIKSNNRVANNYIFLFQILIQENINLI